MLGRWLVLISNLPGSSDEQLVLESFVVRILFIEIVLYFVLYISTHFLFETLSF